MNIHQEILAKSEQNGHVCLYQHLKNVADTARVMAKHLGFDEQIAVEGALLHDIGNNSSLKFEIMAKQLYVASQRVL